MHYPSVSANILKFSHNNNNYFLLMQLSGFSNLLIKDTSINCLFPRLRRQLRAQILMYAIYTPVFGFGFLRRSTSCIHAVVRALLPCTHEKIRINRGTLKISFFLIISLQVFANSEEHQRPMYGGVDRTKNPEFIQENKLFIIKATHAFGTREHASEGYVERGFDLYSKNKFNKSMEHFNQAWLLNEENPYVYLGFGLLLNKEEQSCEAYKMFNMANKKGLKESGFLADYAYTSSQCALSKEQGEQQDLFNLSNKLHSEAAHTPDKALLAYVYHSWAKSYFLQENIIKSQEMIEQSRNLGGTIDNALVQALQIKLKTSN